MRIFYSIILICLFLTFGNSLVSGQASVGCCVDSDNGLCLEKSDKDSCISSGGKFSSGLCTSLNECSLGCCVLGGSGSYITKGECQVISNSKGFEFEFRNSNRRECFDLSNLEDKGACVSERGCIFGTRGICSGNFFKGKFCSDETLNTGCSTTKKTACIEGDVRFLDSCGNSDKVLRACESGNEICGEYRAGIDERLSNGDYTCRTLNCKLPEGGEAKNGERWCVNGFEGFKNRGEEKEHEDSEGITGEVVSIIGFAGAGVEGEGHEIGSEVLGSVGSRSFSQYCLNGEIFTEPCDDFRFGICVDGGCELNPWDQCLALNDEEEELDSGSCEALDHCESIAIFEDEIKKDLHLEMCVPKLKGGIVFWNEIVAEEDGEDENSKSVCSLGDYEAEINFKQWGNCWYVSYEENKWGNVGLLLDSKESIWVRLLNGAIWGSKTPGAFNPYIFCTDSEDEINEWGRVVAGYYSGGLSEIFLLIPSIREVLIDALDDWTFGLGDIFGDDIDPIELGYLRLIAEGKTDQIPVSHEIFHILGERCSAISDCGINANWVGEGIEEVKGIGNLKEERVEGEEDKSQLFMPCERSLYQIDCKLKLDCLPWNAPSEGDCSLCGSDNLPCSEYRCKALGDSCEYVEVDGVDHGICGESSDNKGPEAFCIDCPSSIGPYESVEISIGTNEDAQCRFDIEVGADFEGLPFSFGEKFGKKHGTKLYLPGQLTQSESERYDLIRRDGKYNLVVICQDAFGNSGGPLHIDFEVEKRPDLFAPFLSDFIPESRSLIKFNNSEKIISFKVNEPAECRWSYNNENYEQMNNSFSCPIEISDRSVIEGFMCNGKLSNVTQNLGDETDYYIRCKDLANNTNERSIKYTLGPSGPLVINNLIPEGEVLVSQNNNTIIVSLDTAGGSENGESNCEINIDSGGFLEFSESGGTRHFQTLSALNEGNHLLQVKCEDKVGNIIEKSSEINLIVDIQGPKITRLYEQEGELILLTNEPGMCYLSFNSCDFELNGENLQLLSGEDIKHSIVMTNELIHYIKCVDNNDNEGNCVEIRRNSVFL